MKHGARAPPRHRGLLTALQMEGQAENWAVDRCPAQVDVKTNRYRVPTHRAVGSSASGMMSEPTSHLPITCFLPLGSRE